MAKNGLKTFIRALDRLSREAAKAEKQRERENAKHAAAMARVEKQQEKDLIARKKMSVDRYLEQGKAAHQKRCEQRAQLKETILHTLFP